jgi:hypothetical protein
MATVCVAISLPSSEHRDVACGWWRVKKETKSLKIPQTFCLKNSPFRPLVRNHFRATRLSQTPLNSSLARFLNTLLQMAYQNSPVSDFLFHFDLHKSSRCSFTSSLVSFFCHSSASHLSSPSHPRTQATPGCLSPWA